MLCGVYIVVWGLRLCCFGYNTVLCGIYKRWVRFAHDVGGCCLLPVAFSPQGSRSCSKFNLLLQVVDRGDVRLRCRCSRQQICTITSVLGQSRPSYIYSCFQLVSGLLYECFNHSCHTQACASASSRLCSPAVCRLFFVCCVLCANVN